jgi:phosphatidate cytidylyltransferase
LSEWRTRTISTLLMLFGFIFLIFLGHIALWCLIIFVQTMMFREIVTLGKLVSRERQAPEQNGLQWYVFTFLALYL